MGKQRKKGVLTSLFVALAQTRCVVKFRNVDAVVDIKVTNDKEVGSPKAEGRRTLTKACFPAQCLKFKTDQQQDLKRFEKLSKQLFRTMADIPADFVEPEETATPQAAAVAQSPNVAAASSKKGGKRK